MKMRSLAADYFFICFVAMSMAVFPATGAWGKEGFDLVSLPNAGALLQSHYNGDGSKITPDGRYVVFRSDETQLVTPHTLGYQIFLRDRKNGTTELISASTSGQYGDGSSESATISDDGCRVAFKSDSKNLVTPYVYRNSDVYLRDRCTTPMTTTLVSLNSNGVQSNAASFTPYISGNGKFVAFNSYSTDLVQGVTETDVLYLRDLENQTTILLSASIVDGRGQQAWNPALSYDGNRIAFTAASKELVDGVVAGWNVFLYDANATPPIRLVSSDANGVPQDTFANGDQPQPGISSDGYYVSFYSNAHNLVPDDTNGFTDVFVKNVDTNDIWRANLSSTGVEANTDTRFNSTLSQDGTWVTFCALASTNKVVMLHNIQTGETLSYQGLDPDNRPAISGDLYGRFIANFWGDKLDARYNSTGVFVYDRHSLPVAIANIGDFVSLPVMLNDEVTLDGSLSNNDANISSKFFVTATPNDAPPLSYTWTQTDGTSVTLSDPHAAQPSFTVTAEGTYKFKLVVNDTVEDSAPATVTVQVGPNPGSINQKAIANAGTDQTAAIGDAITLDGSLSSDPDNSPLALSYSWTQIAGLSLNMTGANTATPSFTPMAVGSYSFRLVVNDGKDSSTPAIVTVTVGDGAIPSNIPPVAVAGDDQAVFKKTPVTLSGNKSFDPDGQITDLNFQWTQIAGPSVKVLNPKTAEASFTPAKIGSYSFQLVVKDKDKALSLPSVVTVTVSDVNTGNKRPLAVPEVDTDSILIGSVVKLSGFKSSDPDPKVKPKKLQYQWSQIDGPVKIKLANPKTATPSFTPKLPGFYVFNLAVFDGLDWSTPESVTVYVDASILVTLPMAGDVWDLGTTQDVSFETLGINPNNSIKASLFLYNATKKKWEKHALPNKLKAIDTDFTIIANKISWQTDAAYISICANDQLCSTSDIFSIQ